MTFTLPVAELVLRRRSCRRYVERPLDAGAREALGTLLGEERAVAALAVAPEYLLVDGPKLPNVLLPGEGVVGGDGRVACIAAASILAKVHRDRLMEEHDARWPAYGFAAHKGYGTAAHLRALAEHGPCPIHRRSFRGVPP